jgi:DNA-directed RNA polymerase subunit RPC12/RpoP
MHIWRRSLNKKHKLCPASPSPCRLAAVFKNKKCRDCGEEFHPTGTRQVRCKKCALERVTKNQMKRLAMVDPDKNIFWDRFPDAYGDPYCDFGEYHCDIVERFAVLQKKSVDLGAS